MSFDQCLQEKSDSIEAKGNLQAVITDNNDRNNLCEDDVTTPSFAKFVQEKVDDQVQKPQATHNAEKDMREDENLEDNNSGVRSKRKKPERMAKQIARGWHSSSSNERRTGKRDRVTRSCTH